MAGELKVLGGWILVPVEGADLGKGMKIEQAYLVALEHKQKAVPLGGGAANRLLHGLFRRDGERGQGKDGNRRREDRHHGVGLRAW